MYKVIIMKSENISLPGGFLWGTTSDIILPFVPPWTIEIADL